MPTYRFDHWEINGAPITPSPNPASIDINASITIAAVYQFTEAKAGCFIATAAYGTPLASQLGILRAFRDKFMANTLFGRGLVEAYYQVSPPLARELSKHQRLRWMARKLLNLIVSHLKEWEDMVK